MTDRGLWQALGYRVEKRSLGVCGDGYVLLVPDGGYGPGCGEGRGWGNEPAAWAQLPSADTGNGMLRVIEAMEVKGHWWDVGKYGARTGHAYYYCEFERIDTTRIPATCRFGEKADTAPRAVRLAALRALGVSE